MVYGGVHLPWEWDSKYLLRSVFFPAYLAIPLYILKTLGLDNSGAVLMCPHIAYIPLVVMSDIYLWKIGKQTVGKNATRIALIFYLTAR